MRIITGEWRGRNLPAPIEKVRPTPDRAREALFSILVSRGLDLDGARWLDLYAGTGAIGLEALSRGAAQVVFADRSRRVLARIDDFLHKVEARDRGETVLAQLPRQLASVTARLRGPVDVIFADPPFADEAEPDHILGDPALWRVTHPDTLVIWEREHGSASLEGLPYWEEVDHRRYGRIEFHLLQPTEDAPVGHPGPPQD